MVKKICDKLTMLITWIAGIIIVGIVAVIIVNIIGRAFGRPLKGAVELVQYLTMTMAVLMLSRTCFDDKHIYVSVFTDHIPYAGRMIVYGIGRIICSGAMGVMAYKSYQSMATNAARNTDILKIPYNLLLVIMAIGLALATLMFFIQGCLFIASIKDKDNDPSGETINGFRDDEM